METLFVVLSLKVRRVSSEEIWPLGGFFTVSLLLVDIHPANNIILLFLRCQEMSQVNPKQWKLESEIKALVNERRGNWLFMKSRRISKFALIP